MEASGQQPLPRSLIWRSGTVLALRATMRFGSGIALIAATGWLRHAIGLERAFAVFLAFGAAVATPLYVRFAIATFREITAQRTRVFSSGVEEMLPVHRRWLRALLVMPVILLGLGGLWVATAAGVGSGLMVVSRLSDPPDPPTASSQSAPTSINMPGTVSGPISPIE